MYALFAVVIAGEAIDKDPNLGIFLFSAFSVMAISMPALFGLSTSLALEREMGLMLLKRAQPAPARVLAGGEDRLRLARFGVLAYAAHARRSPLGAGKLAAGFRRGRWQHEPRR